jgi:hypothetical protein
MTFGGIIMKLAMPHIYMYVLVVVVLTFFQTSYAAPVDGRNVNVVEFGDGSGQVLGTYRQVGEQQWVEQNRQGQTTFTFRETQRDDWSVYLHDASRNASLQLDLHRKRVGYSDTNNPQMRDIYAIESSAAAPVNGRNVSAVEFGDGSGQVLGTFRQVGEQQWVEQNRQGQTTFSFQETQRDDWSVYLHDASRNASLQLDLHRKRVGYSDTNNPQMRDVYVIESSSLEPPAQQARNQPQSQPQQKAMPQSDAVSRSAGAAAAAGGAIAAAAATSANTATSQVVKLRFLNASPRDMDVYFNDENGETRYLATVQSGYQLTQPSPVGVRWHLAQDDQWKETYETTSESLQVIRFGD